MHISYSKFLSVSHHIAIPTVCVPQIPEFFSFLPIFQVLQCEFLIFHVFQCFLPYFRSSRVHISVSMFLSVFHHTLHTLQCAFLNIHVYQVSGHIPGPPVCISHFPNFSVLLAIFQVLQCAFLFFQVFQFSHMFQGLPSMFFIFLFFQCFSPYSRTCTVHFTCSTFFSFLPPYSGSYSVHFSFSRFFFFSTYFRSYSVHIKFS